MSNKPLTQKQQNFCAAYVECGSASEAYRTAYNAEKMKTETIHKRANELMSSGAVAGTIKELQRQAAQRNKITVDDLLNELEQARQIALNAEKPQCAAMVAATIGKAKLLGMLDKIAEVAQQIIVIKNPRKFD